MNVANNRMLRRLYEIGPLHLSKFYLLPPQISVFWQLMHSMACFIRITAKLNYSVLYHYEDVALFQKKNHVNMRLFHNVFKRDIRLQAT